MLIYTIIQRLPPTFFLFLLQLLFVSIYYIYIFIYNIRVFITRVVRYRNLLYISHLTTPRPESLLLIQHRLPSGRQTMSTFYLPLPLVFSHHFLTNVFSRVSSWISLLNVSRYVVIVRSTIEGEKGVADEETGREENHAESRRRRGQQEDTEEDASRYCIFFFFFLYFVLSSVALFLLFCLVAASVCTCVRVIIVIGLWMLIRIHEIQNNANSPNIVILLSVFSIFSCAFTYFT